MTALFRVAGTLPPDSPLRRLAGHTVTLPARDRATADRRAAELRQAGAVPVVWQVRPVPWTWIAWNLTGVVLGALAAAITAVLAGDHATAILATAAMVAAGLALFPVLTHHEMESQ
ncbi:hypothetical protein [Micromonospora yangpuensis]|uniref:Uncharacterized protein n=1 Tax=Micromonospora yangpuensis TaxID=683228 RepID=A0A1C6VE75_9ACTN|nr:hypothetical protein [Micromonospora yangpuensis]GGM14442.1 hypothetical protein GCM10012279_35690 [Micromonospora yangpuensis]SCL64663.1 hypothetical protein GA0070617_5525 [Micromonospora yangpuensis]